jgi:hypothetical protein
MSLHALSHPARRVSQASLASASTASIRLVDIGRGWTTVLGLFGPSTWVVPQAFYCVPTRCPTAANTINGIIQEWGNEYEYDLSTIGSSGLSPLDAVEATTGEWGLEPLPSGLHAHNGSANSGDDPHLIELVQSPTVGSISTVSFIYLIMSILIILIMLRPSVDWLRAVMGSSAHHSSSELSERQFRKQIKRRYPPPPKSPPLRSYAETVAREPGKAITSQNLRECRELIREKYALDVEKYNLRDVHDLNQHILDDKIRRSAGALVDIKRIVKGWVEAKEQWSEAEWRQVEEINHRIQSLVDNPHAIS